MGSKTQDRFFYLIALADNFAKKVECNKESAVYISSHRIWAINVYIELILLSLPRFL